ncbi:hypothetical protein PtA15_9A686 [Puccinia triticina]|uniref:CNH domain-containing protein n=1 Tax=Puccinia triticina TaxID=208348 RepID=A0ABY7CTE9_9BASI|nr:uncharacterized protein PtA15_9A686 [Puccinia triticina]WAQ88559.1 hypothetical protein PtA15_9A686 [Puccinia triticina]WAR60733.1 hypothetical protein PtB15_9B672 [Puccinia triticina]
MSSTHSTQAGFLPPFELRRLIRPVFAPDRNPTDDRSQPPQQGPSKNPVIRSVDGHGQLLWVGSNDGRVKGLDIKAHPAPSRFAHTRVASDTARLTDAVNPQPRPHSVSGRLSKPSSPRQPESGFPSQEDIIDTSCFQDCQVFPATDKSKLKAVEKLILVPMVGLAIILSEGTVTFHSITDLQPCPSSSFPFIRGVSAVTLDEHTYNQNNIQSSNQPDDVLMCVIKKKSIFLYLLSMNGVQQVHEVAFASATFQCLLRGSTLLLSDIEQYYLISLEDQPPQVMPLLPISQSSVPVPDDPTVTSSQATRHRPSMAAIPNSQEFLLASHTGSTCLGIFVSSSGDPSRGTLEWPSNPRSVAVDLNHVLALLFNGTIEIHLLATQELVHVISLPDGLDPRSLASAKFGISLPGESHTSQLNTVPFSLEARPLPSCSPSSLKAKSPTREACLTAGTHSRILLVGRDALYALATRTFLAELETLIRQNRWDDALLFAGRSSDSLQRATSSTPSPTRRSQTRRSELDSSGQVTQLHYIYQKISLHYLVECRFEEAGNLWFQGNGDPRIFIRLFPLLVANNLCKTDTLKIFSGLEEMVRDVKSAEELITINLVRNYSPHIKPDVDTALPTVDLKAQLQERARQVLLRYLKRWRRDRLLKGGASDSNRHLDSIIDTALVQLLSERRQVDPEAYQTLRQILERPNSCVFAEIEPVLLENKCFCILAEIYLKRQNFSEAFDIWAKLHDKVYEDEDFLYDLNRMASVLLQCEQVDFVIKYAIWMASLDRHLAVKILVEAKVAHELNVDATFESLREVSQEAAELYLEEAILRDECREGVNGKRKSDGLLDGQAADRLVNLRTKLILGYLDKLKGLLRISAEEGPSPTILFFRNLVDEFMKNAEDPEPKHQSFVDFLLQASPPDGPDHQTSSQLSDALTTRAKLLVCLDQSDSNDRANYDAQQIRSIIEDIGGSAELLAVERAMVYSKIGLHRPALSLLALTLKDIRSAETYSLQHGTILSSGQRLGLMGKGGRSARGGGRGGRETGETTDTLIGILFDLLINSSASSASAARQVRLLLARHPARIPLHSSLERLPENWPLDPLLLAPYLSRAIRKSCHLSHEATIVKAIALGNHISLAVACDDLLLLPSQKD